jgi:NAD(P)-dependent dehydrogenase (short-subunit alcohol dehydrogenase family)
MDFTGKTVLVTGGSRDAFRGEPESPAYGASKAVLNAMSQSLAQRLAPHGIFRMKRGRSINRRNPTVSFPTRSQIQTLCNMKK